MINELLKRFYFIGFAFLLLVKTANATSCHPYIEQLSNGDLKYTVTLPHVQAYVEVFVQQNGIQNIATNIVSSQIANTDGSYTYFHIAPASMYSDGDKIITRFYSYEPASPGVFTPGPQEQVWSSEFIYNHTCKDGIYVSLNGSDNNTGTMNSPVRTITKGITLASAAGIKNVKVSGGTYEEGNINIVNGINILGGYSPDFSIRDLSFTQYVTTIDANQSTGYMVCGEKRILNIDQIYFETIIEGFVMTRGRLCSYGGGIRITNSNNLLVIRNNKIINNSSVGNGSSAGGNIYIENSSPQIFNNIITGGFAGAGLGNDLYIASGQIYSKPNISNNLFTTESAVYGLEKSTHFGNRYLNQTLVHVSTNGNDSNIGTNEAPVKTIYYGIALADNIHASQVRIAQGTYVEGNLNIVNGISIYGGYSEDFFTYNTYSLTTTIDAQQNGGMFVCGSKRIFKAENISLPTIISGLSITGGRLCDYGGGIYINNCSDKLIIQNNKITGNSSVGNGTSAGGNIYVANSSAKILYNEITNGFAGANYGNDIYITGNYSDGNKTEIAYNTITSESSIYGIGYGNVHDNTYLNYNAKMATNNFYLPLEVKLIDDVVFIYTDDSNVNVIIVDMKGKTLITSHEKQIPVSNIATGIYLIKAETESSVITQKIFIK